MVMVGGGGGDGVRPLFAPAEMNWARSILYVVYGLIFGVWGLLNTLWGNHWVKAVIYTWWGW